MTKRLDEMDSLLDVGRFPRPVYSGAVVNVLLTVWATFRLRGRLGDRPADLVKLVALVLAANLSPVVLLRMRSDMDAPKPVVEEMDFFGDQHRFPAWVYVAASANMALWVTVAWLAAGTRRGPKNLPGVLLVSLIWTLLPRLVHRLNRDQPR
ncbi:hypothetical protein [Rubrobacter indicoceani]|uniref:hypothetical protein n=1 Tax=Rubrobacter indicoceani TaxID=2051957 RepID=UPI000E5A7003|nr:hypothetical protein [Rubrobacter indicoceani]